jgi:hypothetical protein
LHNWPTNTGTVEGDIGISLPSLSRGNLSYIVLGPFQKRQEAISKDKNGISNTQKPA